jgi:hypothetical protein
LGPTGHVNRLEKKNDDFVTGLIFLINFSVLADLPSFAVFRNDQHGM